MRIPKAIRFVERRRNKLLENLEVQTGPRTGYMLEEVAALNVALDAMEEKRVRVHEARAERMRNCKSNKLTFTMNSMTCCQCRSTGLPSLYKVKPTNEDKAERAGSAVEA